MRLNRRPLRIQKTVGMSPKIIRFFISQITCFAFAAWANSPPERQSDRGTKRTDVRGLRLCALAMIWHASQVGLAALWVACLNHPKQDLMQAMAGLTLGSSMIAMLLVLDHNECAAAVWNAQVIGSVFVLSALSEFYDHWSGHNIQ